MGPQGSCIKRVSDIIVSVITLVLSSPVLLLCMAAIKLESRGPAIFTQYRAGVRGKPFKMYKLRGMVQGANDLGPPLTQKNDPRLTLTGRMFRRLSIDELPQFVNVLKGDMSIIGPRPEVLEITSQFDDEQKKVFDFKPGITGISQINGRQLLTPDERTRMEIEYYSKETFIHDMRIFFRTFKVIVTNEGNL
jgi:lipopolysaccharide/colanic/teichoic acid biosynthesis glycosyltransferase